MSVFGSKSENATRIRWTYPETHYSSGGDRPTGYLIDIFNDIAMKYDLSYTVNPVGLTLGDVVSPTNGTGVIGYLMRNEADIALASPTAKSALYLYETPPILYNSWHLWTANPQRMPKDPFSIFRTFGFKVWICLLLLVIAVPLFWHWMLKLCRVRTNLTQWYYDCVKSLLRQDVRVSIRPSHRLFFISWNIGMFLLTSAFFGLLLSKLASSNKPVRIDTLEGVANNKDIDFCPITGLEIDQIFINSKNPAYKEIWNRAIERQTAIEYESVDVDGLIESLKAEKSAFLMTEGIVVEAMKLLGMCPEYATIIYSPPEAMFTTPLTFLLRRDVPPKVLQAFRWSNRRFEETGLLGFEANFAVWTARDCINAPADYELDIVKVLELDSFYLTFALLAIGLLASTIVFGHEICCSNK